MCVTQPWLVLVYRMGSPFHGFIESFFFSFFSFGVILHNIWNCRLCGPVEIMYHIDIYLSRCDPTEKRYSTHSTWPMCATQSQQIYKIVFFFSLSFCCSPLLSCFLTNAKRYLYSTDIMNACRAIFHIECVKR